jgi:hypothetical protein
MDEGLLRAECPDEVRRRSKKMLESKGQAPKPTLSRRLDRLAELDFLRALIDLFAAAWGTERMVLRPIPVRVRNRR